MIRPIVIVGATASGKSDLAMALAAECAGAEIIAVDSMQVYRGMDIGTAKPTTTDRQAVRHHCLDLVGPEVEFTVADFARCAGSALTDIDERGGRAVLVAGTGLYLRAVTDPMEIPGRWPDVRDELDRRLVHEGAPALHSQLARLDPRAAARMDPNNPRRVVRALEVTLGSGRPFSAFGPGLDHYPETGFTMVGVQWERTALAVRIERRVHRMIELGLVDEVRELMERPQGWSRTARQALGYKELLHHLEGGVGLDEAVAEIVLRTRQFAVRQERWFRRDPRVRWVRIHEDPVAEALPMLRRST